MSTLKECARYANFIERNINEIHMLIKGRINASMYETTEFHKKSMANKDFQDEVVVAEYENNYNITVEEAALLLGKLLGEKLNLSAAINEGKKSMVIQLDDGKIGIDTALEYAKALRNSSTFFYSQLGSMKDSKRKEYRFNNRRIKEKHLYLSGSPECCGQKDRSGHQPASFPEKI